MYKTYTNDLFLDLKNNKKYKTIKSKHFKKRIKIFKKSDSKYINPNLKYIFRNCSVKEWLILSRKLEKILKTNDYELISSKIISRLILSFIEPDFHYLLSSYYHYSDKRVSKCKDKYLDISFLVQSLILNNDQDIEHLKLLKKKLHKKTNISSYKFVFEKHLQKISNNSTIDNEDIDEETKDVLKHYFNVNKRKRNFNIFKIRKYFIYDAYLLFFLNLNKYEISNVLFYKRNLNYFDYDFEIFVIKEKISP